MASVQDKQNAFKCDAIQARQEVRLNAYELEQRGLQPSKTVRYCLHAIAANERFFEELCCNTGQRGFFCCSHLA